VGKSGDGLIVAKTWFKLEGEESGSVIEKEKEEMGTGEWVKKGYIAPPGLVAVPLPGIGAVGPVEPTQGFAREKEGLGPGASNDSLKMVKCGNGKVEGQLGVGKSGDGLFVAKTKDTLEGEGSDWVLAKQKERGGWEKGVKVWRTFRASLVVVSGAELVVTDTPFKSEVENLGWET